MLKNKTFLLLVVGMLLNLSLALAGANFIFEVDSNLDGTADSNPIVTGSSFDIFVKVVVDSATPIKNAVLDVMPATGVTYVSAVAGTEFPSVSQYLSSGKWHYAATSTTEKTGNLLLTTIRATAGATAGSATLSFDPATLSAKKGLISVTSTSTPKTITIQAAAAACTANDWDVVEWSTCSVQCGSGTQTRTVNKKTTSTCTGDGGKPGTSQNCAPTCPVDKICTNNQCVTPPACTASDWSCPTWESIACPESGTKTRTCTLNNQECTNPTGVKPAETQPCSQPVAACVEGAAISTGCSCVTPKEEVNGRCTSVMTDVKTKLQEVTQQNKLTKISEIALRLKNFFTSLFGSSSGGTG